MSRLAHEGEPQQRKVHDGDQASADQRGAAGRADQPGLETDCRGGDDEGEGGCLQQGGGHDPPAANHASVQQSRKPSDGEERDQEERQPQEVRRAGHEGAQVELQAAGHEEHRNQEAIADRLELYGKVRVRPKLVLVDQTQRRAGQERRKERFKAELLRQRGKRDQQDDGGANPDLGRRVLQADEQRRQPPDALEPLDAEDDQSNNDHEAGQQDQLRDRRAGLAREEQGEEDDGAEIRDGGGGDDQLAKRRRGLAGVLEHGNDQAERGGEQDDADQQRAAHQAKGKGEIAGEEREDRRAGKAETSKAQRQSPQSVEVDLHPGEKQEKSESENRKDLHRQVHPDPSERGRPDHDPGDDLDDDAGGPHAREEAEQKRRGKGDQRNH